MKLNSHLVVAVYTVAAIPGTQVGVVAQDDEVAEALLTALPTVVKVFSAREYDSARGHEFTHLYADMSLKDSGEMREFRRTLRIGPAPALLYMPLVD